MQNRNADRNAVLAPTSSSQYIIRTQNPVHTRLSGRSVYVREPYILLDGDFFPFFCFRSNPDRNIYVFVTSAFIYEVQWDHTHA